VLTNIVATHARESEQNNNSNNENNNLKSSDKNVAATKWLIGIGKQSAIVAVTVAVVVIVI